MQPEYVEPVLNRWGSCGDSTKFDLSGDPSKHLFPFTSSPCNHMVDLNGQTLVRGTDAHKIAKHREYAQAVVDCMFDTGNAVGSLSRLRLNFGEPNSEHTTCVRAECGTYD